MLVLVSLNVQIDTSKNIVEALLYMRLSVRLYFIDLVLYWETAQVLFLQKNRNKLRSSYTKQYGNYKYFTVNNKKQKNK